MNCPTCHRPLVYLSPTEYQCQTQTCRSVGQVYRLAAIPEHVVAAEDFRKFDERRRLRGRTLGGIDPASPPAE